MAKKKALKKKKKVAKKKKVKKAQKTVPEGTREAFVKGDGVPPPSRSDFKAPGVMDGVEVIRPTEGKDDMKLIKGPGPGQGFLDPEVGREMGPTANQFILDSYVELAQHAEATICGSAQLIGLLAARRELAEPDIMGNVMSVDNLIRRLAIFRNSLLTHLK